MLYRIASAGRRIGALQQGMRIELNGEERQIQDGLSVAELLAEADPAYRHGLVEINGEYLPMERYGRLLVEGDRVEVILPAFGG